MEKYPTYILALFIIIIFPIEGGAASGTADKRFSFAVIASPRAEIENKKWEQINKGLIDAIVSIEDYDFVIINGDITAYGRWKMWDSFYWLYGDYAPFPFFMGLGNRDYVDNVGDCWDWGYWSFDGCAMTSVYVMEHMIRNYANEDFHFRVDRVERESFFGDTKGSLSYSWDWKGVHFVQLQYYPAYTERLNGFFNIRRYDITGTLTWLADDLSLARSRGIKDIIINFHERNFEYKARMHDKRFFQKIMLTYTPLAIFNGDENKFRVYRNDMFFGNTTVYETGAAFHGLFHLVTYDNGELIVKEMSTKDGNITIMEEHRERRRDHNPTCVIESGIAPTGSIYTSAFIPEFHNLSQIEYWNIHHTKQSNKYIDSSSAGEVYMTKPHPDNEYLQWSFRKIKWDFRVPEFWARYQIRSRATKRLLASDEVGKLTTKGDDIDTYWRIIKTQRDEIMLYNTATNRFLDASYLGSPSANAIFDVENTYKAWELSIPNNRRALENVRYFKSLHPGAYRWPLPNGNNSDEHWMFLGYHDYQRPSPCVGW